MTGAGPEQTQIASPESDPPIYTAKDIQGELRQSEIISEVKQYTYNPETNKVDALVHSFAIVLTQDCDLLWDYECRSGGGGKTLTSVLLYAAEEAANVKANLDRDIWRRVEGNNNERYHLLGRVPAECDAMKVGMPNLIIDFKRFFTLSPQELYHQVSAGSAGRRCRLEIPYREHLQCRAAFYFQRVTLPVPHKYAKT